MTISALSNGVSVGARQHAGTKTRRSQPKDDPLSCLTPGDWRLISHAAGFSVDPSGKLFPLLAFQIGWDRQSGVLPRTQEVTIAYLTSTAAAYRGTERDDLGMMDQIAAAIRFLQRPGEETPRLDVRA